jgi:acyl-CoA thioester hydrolase
MSRRAAADLNRFGHWSSVAVRYCDLDTQGHVNNATFFTYFEQARVEFFEALRMYMRDGQGELETSGAGDAPPDFVDFGFVVSAASCAYRRPIAALTPLAVGVRPTALSRATIELEYAICDTPGGTLYATGATTLVSVDAVTGRPRSLPLWARKALERMGASGRADETSGPQA